MAATLLVHANPPVVIPAIWGRLGWIYDGDAIANVHSRA